MNYALRTRLKRVVKGLNAKQQKRSWFEELKHRFETDAEFRAEMCRDSYEEAMAEAKALVQPVVPPSLPCGFKELPANGSAPQVNRLECRPSRNGHGHE